MDHTKRHQGILPFCKASRQRQREFVKICQLLGSFLARIVWLALQVPLNCGSDPKSVRFSFLDCFPIPYKFIVIPKRCDFVEHATKFFQIKLVRLIASINKRFVKYFAAVYNPTTPLPLFKGMVLFGSRVRVVGAVCAGSVFNWGGRDWQIIRGIFWEANCVSVNLDRFVTVFLQTFYFIWSGHKLDICDRTLILFVFMVTNGVLGRRILGARSMILGALSLLVWSDGRQKVFTAPFAAKDTFREYSLSLWTDTSDWVTGRRWRTSTL